MTLRLPLFSRILIWLLLNLIILGGTFGIFLWTELGGDSLMGRAAGDRSQAPAGALMAELRDRPMVEWERAMARFEEAYPVRVMLLREDGSFFLGAKLEVPAELALRLRALVHLGLRVRRPGRGSLPRIISSRGRDPRDRGHGPRWGDHGFFFEPVVQRSIG